MSDTIVVCWKVRLHEVVFFCLLDNFEKDLIYCLNWHPSSSIKARPGSKFKIENNAIYFNETTLLSQEPPSVLYSDKNVMFAP